ncbi:DUF3107 domain-containing protein [Myceligenerans indicum]|uniref:DUF3107 domain-containing protein n=1 Tax=Myceligenerans indicum TaxID=2593663 RepID=A0ABS1LEV2_9MICO|nr:DUF3107 domain-containing protein [Myceligenerans indicum]MBL0884804.1 DUF3107 domain-containing protein [Myceligenerans indicum]
MEVTIGVQHLPREVVVETEEAADAVATAVRKALPDGVLELTDARGRRVVVPARHIGYVEIGTEEQRKVGFGSL